MNKALVKEAEKYISMKQEPITKYDLVAFAEKQIAGLKADNDARKFAMAMSEKVEKQLREENTKLKTDYEVLSCSVDDWDELQDNYEKEQRKNNELSDQLTKAKELLKWFVWYFREGSSNLVPYKHKVEEVEQFLNEVEK